MPRSWTWFSIPDPVTYLRIYKEFTYFLHKKLLLSSRKYDPGVGSGIRCFFSIPDPDPGFRGNKSTGCQIRTRKKAWQLCGLYEYRSHAVTKTLSCRWVVGFCSKCTPAGMLSSHCHWYPSYWQDIPVLRVRVGGTIFVRKDLQYLLTKTGGGGGLQYVAYVWKCVVGTVPLYIIKAFLACTITKQSRTALKLFYKQWFCLIISETTFQFSAGCKSSPVWTSPAF